MQPERHPPCQRHRANETAIHLEATKQAQELISELSDQSQNSGFAPLEAKHGGKAPGTFAHELLAVSYAGWISPKFQLHVNQVFLDYRMGKLQEGEQQQALPNPLSPRHQRELQKAIAAKVYAQVPEAHRSSAFKRIYSHLKDRFEVGTYKDIDDSRYTEALGAVQSFEIEGEWLESKPEMPAATLDDRHLRHLFCLYIHFKRVYDIYDRYSMYEAMSLLGSRAGVEMHDHLRDGVILADALASHLKPHFDLQWMSQPNLRRT
nr:KilA-N domain-containing protein [Halomonas elongata]